MLTRDITPLFALDRKNPLLMIGSAPSPGSAETFPYGIRVLVLTAEEYQLPSVLFPGLHVVHAPFDDTPAPSRLHLRIAREAARRSAQYIRDGVPVLVTCRAGRNRSGLVCALALRNIGLSPVKATDLVVKNRMGALTNPTFLKIALGH